MVCPPVFWQALKSAAHFLGSKFVGTQFILLVAWSLRLCAYLCWHSNFKARQNREVAGTPRLSFTDLFLFSSLMNEESIFFQMNLNCLSICSFEKKSNIGTKNIGLIWINVINIRRFLLATEQKIFLSFAAMKCKSSNLENPKSIWELRWIPTKYQNLPQ